MDINVDRKDTSQWIAGNKAVVTGGEKRKSLKKGWEGESKKSSRKRIECLQPREYRAQWGGVEQRGEKVSMRGGKRKQT